MGIWEPNSGTLNNFADDFDAMLGSTFLQRRARRLRQDDREVRKPETLADQARRKKRAAAKQARKKNRAR